VEHRIDELDAALADHLLGPFIERPTLTTAARDAHGLEGKARLLAN
jgi:hypothetical protein